MRALSVVGSRMARRRAASSERADNAVRHYRHDRNRLQLAFAVLQQDIDIAVHGVIVNRFAASIVVPRFLRFIVYRSRGIDTKTANIFNGVQFAGNRTRLGAGTFVNTNVHFEDVAPIIVGDDCQIGMEVLFVTSHHSTADGVISRTPEPRPITVGDRCWIGARATILPGVDIGHDCVIAAGAVVAKDCEPYGVYGGVPARRIKDLRYRDST